MEKYIEENKAAWEEAFENRLSFMAVGLYQKVDEGNVFDNPKEQSEARFDSALARKGRMKSNHETYIK